MSQERSQPRGWQRLAPLVRPPPALRDGQARRYVKAPKTDDEPQARRRAAVMPWWPAVTNEHGWRVGSTLWLWTVDVARLPPPPETTRPTLLGRVVKAARRGPR